MPVGDFYHHLKKGCFQAFIVMIFGCLDIHTHLRIRPLLSFLDRYIKSGKTYKVLEIGCGDGVNAFELMKIARRKNAHIKYIGFDLDQHNVDKAIKLADALHVSSSVNMTCADVRQCTFNDNGSFDIVLLMDFLEHVEYPHLILQKLQKKFAPGAVCLVSVPTYKYKDVFGAAYHRAIGHVKDGYDIQELNCLFESAVGGQPISHSYSTGLISSLGCSLYYRTGGNNNTITAALKTVVLYPFIFLDIYNNKCASCSLFAVYRIAEGKK